MVSTFFLNFSVSSVSLPDVALYILATLIFAFILTFLYLRYSSSSSKFLPFSSTSLFAPITISKIFIYPIKSCRGIEMLSADITTNGLRYDHQFAVINSLNEILTLRSRPKMAGIVPAFDESMDKLIISAPNHLAIEFSLEERVPTSTDRIRCRIWDDVVDGYEVDPTISQWFSDVIGEKKLKFVRYTAAFLQTTPEVKSKVNIKKPLKSFTESSYLLISEESLIDFNQHLSAFSPVSPSRPSLELTILRFRPNIVVKGCQPYDEDQWDGLITSGGIKLSIEKLCTRCSMPNVHPIKGIMDTSLTISRVLKSYRTGKHLQLKSELDEKFFLGVQLDNDGESLGSLFVGDKLEIIH